MKTKIKKTFTEEQEIEITLPAFRKDKDDYGTNYVRIDATVDGEPIALRCVIYGKGRGFSISQSTWSVADYFNEKKYIECSEEDFERALRDSIGEATSLSNLYRFPSPEKISEVVEAFSASSNELKFSEPNDL